MKQLQEALKVYVKVSHIAADSVFPILYDIAHVLSGLQASKKEELVCMMKIFGIPLLIKEEDMEKSSVVSAVVQLGLCIGPLRSPSLILVRPQHVTSPNGHTPRKRAGTTKKELSNAKTMDDLRELVEAKQRQIDLIQTRLSKVDSIAKEEKFWLQKQLRELETQVGASKGDQEVREELEQAKLRLSMLQKQSVLDSQRISKMEDRYELLKQESKQLEQQLAAVKSRGARSNIKSSIDSVRRIGGNKWVYVPWFLLLFTALSIAGCYIWAFKNKHFLPGQIPFISAVLNNPPESCYGSLVLSVTSFIILVIGLIRYRLNSSLLDAYNLSRLNSSRAMHILNGFGMGVLVLACLGLVGVGNPSYIMSLLVIFLIFNLFFSTGSFQYQNVKYAHMTFGIIFYVCMSLYLILMLRIDFVLRDDVSTAMRVTRVVFACVQIACMIAILALFFFSEEMAVNAKTILEICLSFFIMVHFMTFSAALSGIEVLFDVRRLSERERKRREQVSETTALFHLDDLE